MSEHNRLLWSFLKPFLMDLAHHHTFSERKHISIYALKILHRIPPTMAKTTRRESNNSVSAILLRVLSSAKSKQKRNGWDFINAESSVKLVHLARNSLHVCVGWPNCPIATIQRQFLFCSHRFIWTRVCVRHLRSRRLLCECDDCKWTPFAAMLSLSLWLSVGCVSLCLFCSFMLFLVFFLPRIGEKRKRENKCRMRQKVKIDKLTSGSV